MWHLKSFIIALIDIERLYQDFLVSAGMQSIHVVDKLKVP